MSPQKNSIVWQHFNKLDSDHVLCKICQTKLKYHNSTSNMKSHLKSRHPRVLGDDELHANAVYLMGDGEDGESYQIIPSTSGSSSGVSSEKQVLNYQKLVVPMSMRSVYWKCYGFPANSNEEILTREKIVCLLCKNVISYNRNTSNLRMHLQNKHAEELMQLELNQPPKTPKEPKARNEKRNRIKKEMGNMYSTSLNGSFVVGTDSHSKVDFHSYESPAIDGSENDPHQSGKVVYNKKVAQSSSSATTGKPHVTLLVQGQEAQHCTIENLHPFMIPVESKSVCDAVAEFVVADLQLPDIVEGRGFQRLIATLRSPCEIPSKSKLIDEVIPRTYDSSRETVQETLLAIKSEVALTVEEWDSAIGDTYVTFSICFQKEKDDNLYSKVLTTTHCPPSVDISYWKMILENLFEEWSIKVDKVKAVVCGSCRTEILDSFVSKGLIVLPCLVQTLQDVCTRVCFDQDDVREILTKCRTFIYTVYKNSTALAALRIQDHLMLLEEMPLASDYPRVWISTFLMLEGMLARRQVLSTILENIDPNTFDKDMVSFSDQEWALVEDVLAVLEPFKVTIMTLSEEKSPLVSLLKPLLWQLLSCHLKEKDEDSVNTQVFKAAMKTGLSEKYSEPAVNQLLQIACTLDPRFKSLPNSVEESQAALEGPIKAELTALIQHEIFDEPAKPVVEEETPVEKKKPRLSGMVMLLGDMTPTSSKPLVMSCADRANLEIVQYQSEPVPALDQCPVAWWNIMASKCPRLARLAAQYICVPATAIPPSRLAMDAQISYEIKRANLPPEVVDRLVFLNSNQ